ncbi:MAG: hypothetical protein ABW169_07345 [Sphingobium sp.]
MKSALLSMVGFLMSSPAIAQTMPPAGNEGAQPSASAMELAHILKSASLPRFQFPEEAEMKDMKASFGTVLVWRGQPCDLKNEKCDAVATEISARMVHDRRAYMAKLAEYAYALHFQRTLSLQEISDSIAVAKTDAGKKLLVSLMSAPSGKTFQEVMNPYSGFLTNAPFPMWKDTPYREEFYDRTKGLPRRVMHAPPPPPAPRPIGGQK